jgi:histidine ammonia-lyase
MRDVSKPSQSLNKSTSNVNDSNDSEVVNQARLAFKPGDLQWSDIQALLIHAQAQRYLPVEILWDTKTQRQLQACSDVVQAIVRDQKQTYGINTGFGLLANTSIAPEALEVLQSKLVLSHAAGVGQPMPLDVVYLATLLKINALSQGLSGVRPIIIEQLTTYLNRGILAKIPEKGSVGASGDLAPLAHLSLTLMGEGECWYQGQWVPTKQALDAEGIEPLILGPKEGLALLNGTQISTAYALKAAWRLENILKQGLLFGAMSVEAVKGSRTPFDERIHLARNQKPQQQVAAIFRALLPLSPISKSHEQCGKVQDPYSLRCQPQVMGACLQQWQQAQQILMNEANGVSDNPLIFTDTQEALSGGNFHAEPVAMAADNMALAFAEVGALSERRLALLMDHHLSGLPPFLVAKGGLNSGFMIAQVTAAALASENKQLATPSSVDSLPTSANQEDQVSMATYAARRLLTMADNTAYILAIEWLAAAQGCEFHLPLTPAKPIATAIERLRKQVSHYDEDRFFAPDIEMAKSLVDSNQALQGLETIFDFGLKKLAEV